VIMVRRRHRSSRARTDRVSRCGGRGGAVVHRVDHERASRFVHRVPARRVRPAGRTCGTTPTATPGSERRPTHGGVQAVPAGLGRCDGMGRGLPRQAPIEARSPPLPPPALLA
jgi:hypothetical protein